MGELKGKLLDPLMARGELELKGGMATENFFWLR